MNVKMGNSKHLSEQEQSELRKQASLELERLEAILEEAETKELLDRYKNRFNLCESTYKLVLREHQIRTKGEIKGQLKLDMRQVPFAMQFAGYTVEKELLNRLFGSESSQGKRSAKKLRGSVTHGIEQHAVNEIKARRESLFQDMDDFLAIIRAA